MYSKSSLDKQPNAIFWHITPSSSKLPQESFCRDSLNSFIQLRLKVPPQQDRHNNSQLTRGNLIFRTHREFLRRLCEFGRAFCRGEMEDSKSEKINTAKAITEWGKRVRPIDHRVAWWGSLSHIDWEHDQNSTTDTSSRLHSKPMVVSLGPSSHPVASVVTSPCLFPSTATPIAFSWLRPSSERRVGWSAALLRLSWREKPPPAL